MSYRIEGAYNGLGDELRSDTYPALLQLPRPLLEYRVVIAVIEGDVGAVNLLKDALALSKESGIRNILLALGPTTPISLKPPHGSRILWATFTDKASNQPGQRTIIIHPNHLTDLSLNLEKLSRTRGGRVQLILGDFLDNVLSVSSSLPGLYAFLCQLFTRIRTNQQTGFFIATSDMHEQNKTAILKRFADAVIEYRATNDGSTRKLQARILDHANNHYGLWDSDDTPDGEFSRRPYVEAQRPKIGRQDNILVKEPLAVSL